MRAFPLFVLLVVGCSWGLEEQANPYINDEVALPDVISMMQMKAGVGVRAQSTASPILDKGDVVAGGVVYAKGKIHTGDSLFAHKEVKANGKIISGDAIEAKTALKTEGKVEAKGVISATEGLATAGTLSVDNTATIKGAATVGLDLHAAGVITTDKGITSSDIIRGKENIVCEKSFIATNLLQSTGGIYTKGVINGDDRVVAKGDIHTDKMLTAKEGIVTPGNVFAEDTVKATKDVRADNLVYGGGLVADSKGVSSKGLIHGKGDIKADAVVVGVKGVNSNLDVTADVNVVAKKEVQGESLKVTKDAKVMGGFSVAGQCECGSANIKGKLYVGDRAIGDVVSSMEADMLKMRAEMSETKESLRQAMMMLEKMAA